jgi:hypothetical protein
MTNEQFEKQVRTILDSQIKANRKDKRKVYVKKLKNEHGDKINLIIKILKDYE